MKNTKLAGLRGFKGPGAHKRSVNDWDKKQGTIYGTASIHQRLCYYKFGFKQDKCKYRTCVRCSARRDWENGTPLPSPG